jgi:4-amino-4-deoxy-L-arabinose transferase-like glycosyltransferase
VESLAEKARKWTRSIVSESTIGALLLVFLLALGLRLAYVVSGQRLCAAPTYDGISYDLLATHLIGGQGYSLGAGQSAFRPPAYSFFLALLYLLVGRNYCAIRIAQALLGAFTPVLLYGAVARQFPGRRSLALLAAAGVVVHPLLIYMAGLIYPETLSIFLLALFWYLLARPASRWPYLQWAMGGCLLGLICLMRPNVLLLSVTLLPWALVINRPWRVGLRSYIVILAFTLITIVPWTVRNYLAFNDFIPISTNGGVNLWQGNNALANGGRVEVSPDTWLGPDPPSSLEGWDGLTERESEQRFQATAVSWIRDHPGQFLSLLPQKLVRAWSINFGDETRQVALPWPLLVGYAGFLVLCGLGLLLSFQNWRESMFVYLLIANVCLISLIYYGFTRQSSLALLGMVTLAAMVGDWVLSRLAKALRPRIPFLRSL